MTQVPDKLTIRGTTVRCHRGGRGPKAIFLHGAGGIPQWLPFFDRLAQRFEILVPEHPGFGRSDDPKSIRNVPDLAMFYLDMLDALDLRGVHLIGNSLGGWTAAELAIRNLGRVASLTLLAPAGIRVKGIPPGDNFIWSPEEAAAGLFHDPAFGQAMLAAGPPQTDEDLDELLHNRQAATKFGWEPRWLNPDLEKWLHRITVPTHVVWGREDRLLPAAYAARWIERVPGATLTMIDGCGHLPHVEKAQAVADKVLSFLEQVAA